MTRQTHPGTAAPPGAGRSRVTLCIRVVAALTKRLDRCQTFQLGGVPLSSLARSPRSPLSLGRSARMVTRRHARRSASEYEAPERSPFLSSSDKKHKTTAHARNQNQMCNRRMDGTLVQTDSDLREVDNAIGSPPTTLPAESHVARPTSLSHRYTYKTDTRQCVYVSATRGTRPQGTSTLFFADHSQPVVPVAPQCQ